jgi:hypothetical protein
MCTWVVNTFDNDRARAWAYGLDETDDLFLVRDTQGYPYSGGRHDDRPVNRNC